MVDRSGYDGRNEEASVLIVQYRLRTKMIRAMNAGMDLGLPQMIKDE